MGSWPVRAFSCSRKLCSWMRRHSNPAMCSRSIQLSRSDSVRVANRRPRSSPSNTVHATIQPLVDRQFTEFRAVSEGSTLILEQPEFPYDTQQFRIGRKEAPMPKTSSIHLVVSIHHRSLLLHMASKTINKLMIKSSKNKYAYCLKTAALFDHLIALDRLISNPYLCWYYKTIFNFRLTFYVLWSYSTASSLCNCWIWQPIPKPRS